jgi:hypothetical protein
MGLLLASLFSALTFAAPASSAHENSALESVKEFFPTGTYRKIGGGSECQDGDLTWRDDKTMTFGFGASPLIFYAFDSSYESPASKDNCVSKTTTKIAKQKTSKQQTLKVTQTVSEKNCGSSGSRVLQYEMMGTKHHAKLEVTVTSKDSTRSKPLVCKYERSLP